MEAFLEFISSLENWKNIALICGAPFAIGSFFKLLRRDKKKDEQISNLSSIASSQEGQITELKRSVEQLTLIAEYHGKFVDLYGRGMEDSREQRELQDKLRKTELKPNIKLRGSSGTRNYKFINRGQDAKIISVEVIEGKTAISLRNILKGQKLGEGHEFGIDINNQLEVEKRAKLSVKIIFNDMIGTKYYQEIDFNWTGTTYSLDIPDAKEISETTIKKKPELS